MKAKEELSAALEKVQEEARQQQEALAIQVSGGGWITSTFWILVLLWIKKSVSLSQTFFSGTLLYFLYNAVMQT